MFGKLYIQFALSVRGENAAATAVTPLQHQLGAHLCPDVKAFGSGVFEGQLRLYGGIGALTRG